MFTRGDRARALRQECSLGRRLASFRKIELEILCPRLVRNAKLGRPVKGLIRSAKSRQLLSDAAATWSGH